MTSRMVNPRDELSFWAGQFVEHFQILVQMFVDAQAQSIAGQLAALWKQAVSALPSESDPVGVSAPLRQQSRAQLAAWLTALRSGTWLGWAPAALLNHMVGEAAYLDAMVSAAPPSQAQLTAYWAGHQGDEAGLSAHLADPSEGSFTREATSMSDWFHGISHLPSASTAAAESQVRRLSQQLAHTIETVLMPSPPKILTTMPPALAAHADREIRRYLSLYA